MLDPTKLTFLLIYKPIPWPEDGYLQCTITLFECQIEWQFENNSVVKYLIFGDLELGITLHFNLIISSSMYLVELLFEIQLEFWVFSCTYKFKVIIEFWRKFVFFMALELQTKCRGWYFIKWE